MASPDTIPCSCCDGEATHRGTDGFYRCEKHRLHADLATFEVAIVEDLRAQLAAVTAQRDGLLAAGEQVADALRDIAGDGHRAYLDAWELAIARAQSNPIQYPASDEPPIQGGECSFLEQLPKGPALGRFSVSERAELDELKRKAFKAGEP